MDLDRLSATAFGGAGCTGITVRDAPKNAFATTSSYDWSLKYLEHISNDLLESKEVVLVLLSNRNCTKRTLYVLCIRMGRWLSGCSENIATGKLNAPPWASSSKRSADLSGRLSDVFGSLIQLPRSPISQLSLDAVSSYCVVIVPGSTAFASTINGVSAFPGPITKPAQSIAKLSTITRRFSDDEARSSANSSR